MYSNMFPFVSETLPNRSACSCESKGAYNRIDSCYRTLFAVRTNEPDTMSTACGRANSNRSSLSFCVIPEIRMAAPRSNILATVPAHRLYCVRTGKAHVFLFFQYVRVQHPHNDWIGKTILNNHSQISIITQNLGSWLHWSWKLRIIACNTSGCSFHGIIACNFELLSSLMQHTQPICFRVWTKHNTYHQLHRRTILKQTSPYFWPFRVKKNSTMTSWSLPHSCSKIMQTFFMQWMISMREVEPRYIHPFVQQSPCNSYQCSIRLLDITRTPIISSEHDDGPIAQMIFVFLLLWSQVESVKIWSTSISIWWRCRTLSMLLKLQKDNILHWNVAGEHASMPFQAQYYKTRVLAKLIDCVCTLKDDHFCTCVETPWRNFQRRTVTRRSFSLFMWAIVPKLS